MLHLNVRILASPSGVGFPTALGCIPPGKFISPPIWLCCATGRRAEKRYTGYLLATCHVSPGGAAHITREQGLGEADWEGVGDGARACNRYSRGMKPVTCSISLQSVAGGANDVAVGYVGKQLPLEPRDLFGPVVSG